MAKPRGQRAARRARSERGGDRRVVRRARPFRAPHTHFPGELSLGLARRAALARAFAVRPTLLLLDEPFVSLDGPLALQMQRDLAQLVESRRITTVLVTHDVDEAISLPDRIFVLSARPAHVIGEVRVAKPRSEISREEGRAIAARIEALRGAG